MPLRSVKVMAPKTATMPMMAADDSRRAGVNHCMSHVQMKRLAAKKHRAMTLNFWAVRSAFCSAMPSAMKMRVPY